MNVVPKYSTMSSPAPKSPEQSDKSKRYDRQLRLWGDHGQKFLEQSKICLINATALGTEILKSLVLPGIGAFTIVDGEKVTDEDMGSNFFLEKDSIGRTRAQAATQSLLELNPDVRGDYIDESIEHVMTHTQDFFNKFSVVIATCLSEKILVQLSKLLWELRIPLVACRSIGFLGYLRVQVEEHAVIEAHPDNTNPDLHLDRPWRALREYLESVDLSKMTPSEVRHVPAVVILYQKLQEFRDAHNGELPKTRSEKSELYRMIEKSIPSEKSDVGLMDENFKEALHLINTSVTPTVIPGNVQTVLDDHNCNNLTQESSKFWVMAAALRELVETEGALPLRGSLPDMAADTKSFVSLQQLYQKQAHVQAEAVHRRAVQLARSIGQSPDYITEAEVKILCKHASELHVIRGTSLADEFQSNNPDLSSHLEDPDSLMFYYVILRGLERFISEFNTYPGQLDDQVEPDVLKLKSMITKMLAEWGCVSTVRDERIHEICRYGGAELHSVSALLAGCAAHEVIKLLTHQYKPLNNTFIYDAISSTSATFCL